MEQTTPQQHHTLFFVSLFSALILIFILMIAGLFLAKRNASQEMTSTQSMKTTPSMSPTMPIGNGVLSLIMPQTSLMALNSTAAITVVGSSDNKAITGYDVIVTYDPTYLQFVNQVNSNATYTIYPAAKQVAGTVILSGAKNVNATSQILNNTVLMNLQFKALKKGQTNVSLQYIAGSKKDSNLVDDQNMDVLGKVEGLSLTIN